MERLLLSYMQVAPLVTHSEIFNVNIHGALVLAWCKKAPANTSKLLRNLICYYLSVDCDWASETKMTLDVKINASENEKRNFSSAKCSETFLRESSYSS